MLVYYLVQIYNIQFSWKPWERERDKVYSIWPRPIKLIRQNNAFTEKATKQLVETIFIIN